MKILRIRGKNLNSLATFDLDFAQAPLQDAALFGLTGPTGAGKSTILDALCLALYRQTPRLQAGKAADVEDMDITAADPRNYLRKGTAEAEATVDFQVHGQHFRARWNVKRAHGKVTGALQNDTHVLEKIDAEGLAQVLHDQRSTVAMEVAKLTGLGYAQFSRAVLLAQGEFAELLRAKAADRADLLEKLTGGEIYARIGTQAFVENRLYEDAQKDVRLLLDTVQLATDEERQTWQMALETAQTQIQQLETRQETLVQARTWHENHQQLEHNLQQGQELWTRATQRQTEVEGLRQQVAEVEAVQPLATGLLTRDQDAAQVLAKTRDQIQAETQAVAAKQQMEQAAEHLPAAQTVHQRVLAEKQALEPHLRAASELDGGLQNQRQLAQNQEMAAQAAEQERRTAQDLAHRAEQARNRLQTDRDGLETRLQADVRGAQLLEILPELRADLRRLQQQREALKPVQREVAATALKLPVVEKNHRTALENVQKQELERRQAVATAEQLGEEARLQVVAELRAQWTAVQKQLTARLAVQKIAQTLEESLKRLQETEALVAQSRRQQADLLAQEPGLKAQEQLHRGALEQAERATHKARELLGLERFVPLLEAEKPCPLCGSHAHPAPQQPGSAQPLLKALEVQTQEAHERLTATQTQFLKVQADLHATGDMLERQQRAVTAEQQAVEAVQKQWPPQERLPQNLAEVLELQTVLTTELGNLQLAEEAARQKLESAETLQARHGAAQTLVMQLTGELTRLQGLERQAESALVAVKTALQTAQTEHLRLEDEGKTLELALEPLWKLNRPWQQANVQELEVQLDAQMHQVLELRAELQRKTAEVQEAQTAAELARQTLTDKTETAKKEREKAETEQGKWAELQTQRAQLLGGKSVAVVQADMARAEQTAQQAVKAAEELHAGLREKWQTARALAEQLAVQLEELRKQAMETEKAWQDLLEHSGLAEAEVRARLAVTREQQAQWRAQVRESDEAVLAAKEGLRLQQEALAKHGQPPEQAQTLEEAETQLETAKELLDEARTVAARHRQQLAADEEARQKTRTLATRQTELLELGRPWKALSERIGSADGKRLKNRAQGIAFAWLVESANAHLQQLRPRYALKPTGANGLDLLVMDRDQGDVLRPVNMLSGGETFLVSLALALGLSSLASGPQTGGAQCDFLFIDEGFGTLDAETLDVAFGALESLQASGRRVGVVTHVEEAKERLTARIDVVPVGGGLSQVRVREVN